jgi:hypothetical protein
MNRYKTEFRSALLILMLIPLAINSCEEEKAPVEGGPAIENPSDSINNAPPEMCEVFVENITHNSAIIYWTAAFDPEQDTLEYSVYLFDSMILAKASQDSLLHLKGLVPDTDYEGKVQVSDPFHSPTESIYAFTTKPETIAPDRTYSCGAASSIQQTSDRGYMVLSSKESVEGITIPYVFRIDSLGYMVWDLVFEISYNSYMFNGELLKTSEGTYLLASRGILSMIDDQGKIIWKKNFEDRKIIFQSVQEVEDRGFIATAEMDGKDALYMKFNKMGELEQEALLAPAISYSGVCINKTDNEIFCQATTTSHDILWTAKLSDSGEVLWESRYATNSSLLTLRSFHRSADGGFVTAGYSMGERNIVVGRVIKFDSAGKPEWDKSYNWHSFKTYIYGMKPESDGYLIWGSVGYDVAKAFLAKIDFGGEITWLNYYAPDYMDYVWGVNDAIPNQEGGYSFCGFKTFVWSGTGKEIGAWVKRVKNPADNLYLQ